jgi:hypothetical protein
MNPVRVLLLGSLAANMALGAWLVWRPGGKDAPREAVAETPGPVSLTAPEAATGSVPAGTGESARSASAWSQLRGESDVDFVRRLEAEGFPRETIRAIVRVQVTARYKARRRELEQRKDALPWWQGGPMGQISPEIRQAERALQREMETAISAALGVPLWLYLDEDVARAAKRYGNLPLDKLARLQEIERDYGELGAVVRAEADGVLLPEDHERMALLDQEKRRDLAAILTPDELAEFDRRSSPRAERLRNQMRWFEATEAEYIALYEAWKAFDERTNLPEPTSRETAARRAEAERELDPTIAAILGTKRHEEYKLSSHPAMGRVRSMTDKFGLPREAAFAAVKIEANFTQRAEAVRAGGANAQPQLQALTQEATAELERILGPDAFSEYRQSNTGAWLQRLQRTQNPTPR